MQYAGSQYGGGGGAGGAGYSGQQQGYGYPGQYYQQQPQPIQQQYSGQQPQQYSGTPYAGTIPFPQPSPYAAPSVLQPVSSQQSAHRPPRTQTPHPNTRRHSSSANTRRPLRSAMKDPERSRSNSTNGHHLSAPVSRTRRQSGGPESRPRVDSISRTRTNSSSRAEPGTLNSTSLKRCRDAFS